MAINEPIDLDELEALERAATPGPWVQRQQTWPTYARIGNVNDDVGHPDRLHVFGSNDACTEMTDESRSNAELVVATRNALPALITELRELRAENNELRELSERVALFAVRHIARDKELAHAISVMQDFKHRVEEAPSPKPLVSLVCRSCGISNGLQAVSDRISTDQFADWTFESQYGWRCPDCSSGSVAIRNTAEEK